MGSKIFLCEYVHKCSVYQTHTFEIVCLPDIGRQKHFFQKFSIFEIKKIQECAKKKILPIKLVSLLPKYEKPMFWR